MSSSDKRKRSRSDSSESDGEGKVRNRTVIKERERQWQTVGSSDDESTKKQRVREQSSSDDSSSDSSSDNSSRGESRKKHKKESKDKKKKDKDRKHHKHKKDRKKDSKKDKKRHKDKSDRKETSSSSRSINQNEYGKYGIIKDDNFFHKQREFEAYMAEVKGIPGVLSEGKREIMQHFKSYMEDYNTATMPHEKYYNYERWEMQEYQRQKQDQARRSMAQDDDGCLPMNFNDEEIRRRELKKMKDEAEHKEFMALKNKMSANKDIQGDMRRQAQLSTELQLAFKRGDTATVKRLERMLAPEEAKVTVKHPWA